MDINSKILKSTKLVAMDFDGVLTDGGIYINDNGDNIRRMDVKDGLGLKLLQREKIFIAWISGSNSEIINKRGTSLGITIIKKGISNKKKTLKSIQDELSINPNETVFLGDDINDLLLYCSVFSSRNSRNSFLLNCITGK